MNPSSRPELLAPAGSPAALDAALDAGADAVYFGIGTFNARMQAQNFTPDEAKSAIARAHEVGVRCYLAMNTLIFDREYAEALRQAEALYTAGADAFIVADLGFAAALRHYFPDLPLHASTQCGVHNTDGARFLAGRGFARIVAAREMDKENLAFFCAHSPLPTEVFLHGALCVSQSGECLFSSFLGGRSGNRGACAQPCRMSYNGGYPLSLKDLCLGAHLRELCAMGVASLKIEGRRKSPDYVAKVTSLYRRLLDEERDATPREIAYLAGVFSRSGFTDGYFTRRPDDSMFGIRRKADKAATAAEKAGGKVEKAGGKADKAGGKADKTEEKADNAGKKALPAALSDAERAASDKVAWGKAAPDKITPDQITSDKITSDQIISDKNAPDKNASDHACAPPAGRRLPIVLPLRRGKLPSPLPTPRALARILFGTADMAASISTNPMTANPMTANPMPPDPMATEPMPPDPMAKNPMTANPMPPDPMAAKPMATKSMTPDPMATEPMTPDPMATKSMTPDPMAAAEKKESSRGQGNRQSRPFSFFPATARFYRPETVPKDPAACGLSLCYLPLDRFCRPDGRAAAAGAAGVILPPVIFDSERAGVLDALKKAYAAGARHGMVSGPGALALCREAGLVPHGDFRLNIASTLTAALWQKETADVLLSPELILPQIRDIPGPKSVTVYGRQILMTLEVPIGASALTDRTGARFDLLREGGRTLLLNSRPTYMADRGKEIAGASPLIPHFLFTTENSREIASLLSAYRTGRPAAFPLRRIMK